MHFGDRGTLIDYKTDEKAKKFKESGNNEYINKKYFDALNSYNKSICYASTKYALSLGYANRSAVYLQIDCFDECLKNIEWARENRYPADKLSKLEEREQKCKKLMSEGKKYVVEDPWNFFKLSYPANKKIPWIVDCLELRTTQKYGRGIYATQDLKAGDIISVEEPVIHTAESNYYRHCVNCYNTCLMNLIPCTKTTTLMFCSIDCMDNFHKKTIDIKLSRVDDMRYLSEIAATFGGYRQLDNFINKKDLKDFKKTIFDYDLSDPKDPDYRKKLMMCFLSLHPRDIFQAKDEIISNYVSMKTAMHILSLPLANATADIYLEDHYCLYLSDGANISLFHSLVNHSCLQNVIFISVDNKAVGYVIRPIKAGEQLFDCYYDRNSSEHDENMNRMMQIFNFKCDCQECLDRSFKYCQYTIPLPHTFMSRKDFTKAKEYLKDCWDKLNNSKDPQELIIAEEQSFIIMSVLAFYATYPCQIDKTNLHKVLI